MAGERFIDIGTPGIHVRKRNEHLIKATLATVGAIAGGVVIGPEVSVPLGSAALLEVAKAAVHQEERINGR